MIKGRRAWIPMIAVAFVIFYVGVYFQGEHSEGYRFLDHVVRASPTIQQRVGAVTSTRMSFLGGYREKDVASEAAESSTVYMTLIVEGTKGSLNVKCVAKKTGGTWKVVAASINGETVSLK